MTGTPITAVIGVRHDGPLTWYLRRSMRMANYPGVWSLPSIQFAPEDLPDIADLDRVSAHFARLSAERLGDVPVTVRRHLTSGTSDMNPMGVDVTLHLYLIDLPREPVLDPAFYLEADWLSAADYEERSAGQPCGLCTRLWGDFAWACGITDRPFLARPHQSHAEPA